MVTISYVLLRALVSQPLHHWPRQDVQSGRMMWRREIWSCSCHSLQFFFFCLFPFCAISHARDKESFMKYYSTECRTVGTDNYKKCPFRDASSWLVEIIGLFISISAHSAEFPTFSQIIIISGRPFLNPFINFKTKEGEERKGSSSIPCLPFVKRHLSLACRSVGCRPFHPFSFAHILSIPPWW